MTVASKGVHLSVKVSGKTRDYLEEMSKYHMVSLSEAVRALIDLGIQARDAAGGQVFPAASRWVDDPRKI